MKEKNNIKHFDSQIPENLFPIDIDFDHDYYDTFGGSIFDKSFAVKSSSKIMLLINRTGSIIRYCEELKVEKRIENVVKDYLLQIFKKSLANYLEKNPKIDPIKQNELLDDIYKIPSFKNEAKCWVDSYIAEFKDKRFINKAQFITFREIVNQTYFFKYTDVDKLISKCRLEPRYKQEWD